MQDLEKINREVADHEYIFRKYQKEFWIWLYAFPNGEWGGRL